MAGEYGREPCPDRIIDDVGSAFSMGAVGGSAIQFYQGMRNSPRGARLLGASQAIRLHAPRIGGSFAVWGGLFSVFDCSLVYARGKEDPWNMIAAGFLTGGFLQLRAGPRSALQSAVFGGVLLAFIEGAGIMLNRMTTSMPPPPLEEPVPATASTRLPNPLPAFTSDSSSQPAEPRPTNWLSSILGTTGPEPKPVILTEKLDSFDANPPPPTPDFGSSDDSWLKSK